MNTETAYQVKIAKKEISVYKCLAYFDIFNHPLTINELAEFCEVPVSEKELHVSLALLLDKQLIRREHDYYFLSSAARSIIQQRISNQANALIRQGNVRKYSSLISKFPFVEGVCISGSFSKGVLKDDGDVDYFIITSPERLWICRTLLIAFKKVVLFNSRKNFCLNYFIDTNNLEIPDRNTFVATEIKTLLPVCNRPLFERFIESNSWANEFLPNKESKNLVFCDDHIKKPLISRILEKLFNTKPGGYFDNLFFRWTLKRWKHKFPEFSFEDFDLNMRTRKNVSKHHPRGFQKKVLEALEQKMNAIRFGI